MASVRGFAAFNDRTIRTVHNIPLPSTLIVAGDVIVVSVAGDFTGLTVSAAIDGTTVAPATTMVGFTGHHHLVYTFRATAVHIGNTFDVTVSTARRIVAVVVDVPGIPTGTYLQAVPAGTTNSSTASTTKTTPAATAAAANTVEIAVLGDTEGTAPGTTAWTAPTGMTMAGGDYHENGGTATPLSSVAVAYNPTNQANGAAVGGRVFTQNQAAPGSAYTLLLTGSAAGPTANAGLDVSAAEPGQVVTLAGSGGVGYQWTPDPALSFSSTTVANPTVEIPSSLEQKVYTNSLSVTDAQGVVSAADTMTITALPSTEATWLAGTQVPLLTKALATPTDPRIALTDDFATDDTTTRWFVEGSGASVVSGVLRVPPTTTISGRKSQGVYSLVGSSAFVKFVTVPTIQPSGPQSAMYFYVNHPHDATYDRLQFNWYAGTLYMTETVNGVETNTNIPYSATDHKFLRLRTTSGTAYWETAPDNGSGFPGAWTVRRTKTLAALVSAANVFLVAVREAGTPVNAVGLAEFDNLNVVA